MDKWVRVWISDPGKGVVPCHVAMSAARANLNLTGPSLLQTTHPSPMLRNRSTTTLLQLILV